MSVGTYFSSPIHLAGLLAGLSLVWRGDGPGKIATMLIDSPNAAPVILFDVIEKVVVVNAHDRPLDVLHSLWKPENAKAYRDEYYDTAFNASHNRYLETPDGLKRMAEVGYNPRHLLTTEYTDIGPEPPYSPTEEIYLIRPKRALLGSVSSKADVGCLGFINHSD